MPRALAVAALLAFVLRALAIVSWMPEVEPGGDPGDYVSRGIQLAETGELEGLYRPPGYVWFIAGLAQLAADPVPLVAWAHALLGALGVVLLWYLVQPLFGGRVALVSCWALALYPTLIGYTLLLFSESLHVFLMLLAGLLVTRGWNSGSLRALGVGGLVLGLAALVKSVTLPIAIFVAASSLVRSRNREGARQAAVILGACLLAIAPTAWRNHARYGGFVLIDATPARTLWHANHILYEPGFDWGIFYVARHNDGTRFPRATDDPVADYEAMMASEVGYVLANPFLILSRVPEKLGALFNPTSFIQRELAYGNFPGLRRKSLLVRAASVLITATWAAVLFLGVLGLVHVPGGVLRTWFLAVLLPTLAVHSVMVSLSRYRLHLVPFLIVLAAWFVCEPGLRERLRSRRTLFGAALILVILVSWWPYWSYVLLERVHPWQRPVD